MFYNAKVKNSGHDEDLLYAGRHVLILPKSAMIRSRLQYHFNEIGFVTKDHGSHTFSFGENLRLVFLPEGWDSVVDYFSNNSKNYKIKFVDEKNRFRGFVQYDSLREDFFLELFCRYSIDEIPSKDSKLGRAIVVKDWDGSIVFTAGSYFEQEDTDFDLDELYKKAKDYLKNNFPEWEDVTKYWN